MLKCTLLHFTLQHLHVSGAVAFDHACKPLNLQVTSISKCDMPLAQMATSSSCASVRLKLLWCCVPCSADAWYMLGQAHMGLGHYRAAISAFRRANQIDPANVNIRSAVLQAEQILEDVQQGKYAQPSLSPSALNAGRNTA